MWKATILACSSCHDQTHCEECRAYSNSPIAFKAAVTKKAVKPRTYTRAAGVTESLSVEHHSVCMNCESKSCFGCTMYNTQFIKG